MASLHKTLRKKCVDTRNRILLKLDDLYDSLVFAILQAGRDLVVANRAFNEKPVGKLPEDDSNKISLILEQPHDSRTLEI